MGFAGHDGRRWRAALAGAGWGCVCGVKTCSGRRTLVVVTYPTKPFLLSSIHVPFHTDSTRLASDQPTYSLSLSTCGCSPSFCHISHPLDLYPTLLVDPSRDCPSNIARPPRPAAIPRHDTTLPEHSKPLFRSLLQSLSVLAVDLDNHITPSAPMSRWIPPTTCYSI